VIVEGNNSQNQVSDIGSGGAEQSFCASRAVLEAQPYDGWTLRLAGSICDLQD